MSRFCLIHRSSTPPSSSFKIYPWRWCDHFLRPPHWISFIALYLRVIDHCCRPRVAVAPPRTPATFSSNFQVLSWKLSKQLVLDMLRNLPLLLTLARPDGIVCVGGDGIVNEVLNGLLSRDNQKEAIWMFSLTLPAACLMFEASEP
ncbi:hypothetical protein BVRB_5g110650 isoform B [Beta vulgaris subsp. vulgaris]|uniref:uncharacterized protein LOC104893510 n=1 Tax=Beta vulgaris subsp. vulgaris TaxID=3555 RepID=UPI00053FA2FF|nr:uncharacterized protein LOC104893510 [Beta vulgaris subsp. vulgaris]XP_010677926.1 uncharacterized protein LOC104893510 [Beta vulgaris subsp. vulgaris]KMT11236.1 hypothetical protein BVRB_5g110650 isoform B [Beta vulgaris subsp. vulgaris]